METSKGSPYNLFEEMFGELRSNLNKGEGDIAWMRNGQFKQAPTELSGQELCGLCVTAEGVQETCF